MKEQIYIGYHGTTKERAEKIIEEKKFDKSNNEDDWLGSGVYFYNNLDNAILYNIRKYKKKYRVFPKYEKLDKEYKILKSCIRCKDSEIIDFTKIDELYKFLWAWKQIHEKIKNNKLYQKLDFKDGYVINWLLNETDYFKGCKLLLNIFFLDLTSHKRINEIFRKKTRIGGYYFHQLYICVLDNSCIESIEYIDEKYEYKYDLIKNLIEIY